MGDMKEDPQVLPKLERFCEINEQFKISFEKIEKNSNFIRYHLDEIHIHYIAHELLHIPQYLESIASHFSDLLPRLLSIAIFFDDEFYKFDYSRHIVNCVLLGKILRLRPDLSSYALKYFNIYPCPFDDPEEQKESKRLKKEYSVSDIELVEGYLVLLLTDTEFYRAKWNWSKFISKYLKSNDKRVRWIAGKCTCVLSKMTEIQAETFMLHLVSKELHYKFSYIFNEKLTLIEYDSPQLDPNPIVNASVGGIIQTNNISGIYIPTKPHFFPIKTSIVEVESTANNLRKIALGLTLNQAVCLQGPVGCGKTTLVEYLAAKTGRVLGKDFIKIQLGDQMDSKMLLGTYRCTDVPGEFVWQAGVLTQAVLEGSWLLMEDIDSANMDIASVLTNLLENKSLSIPGFRDNVPITPGFQLFFTRRFLSTITGHHKKHSNPMTLMKKHLLQINIDPFTPAELKSILVEKHFEFRFITDRLVEVYKLFSYDNPYGLKISRSSRLTSTRDFFKWCSRAIVGFNPQSQESALKVLQDAIDVFCCSHPDLKESVNIAKQISTLLGIVNQKAEYFCLLYKPVIESTTTEFIAGRVSMKKDMNQYIQHLTYTFTRPSAVLLERIMCCVSSAEPVLLVGETGTGKTSTVQYLASVVGKKLVVINMNQQSDSADLLGGFKPVDLKFVITPLKKEFDQAFFEYFKVGPNRKYLDQLEYLYNTEKWSELVSAMKISYQAAINNLNKSKSVQGRKRLLENEEDMEKAKKRDDMKARWSSIGQKIEKLTVQLKQKTALAFAFIEGTLVKAIQKGYWVLLDEINLANAETLECLSGLLEGSNGSLCLLERGDKEPITRHPDFTLFACMNPSTDVGKRDLPPGLRNRFTEFFVHELTEKNDLLHLVVSYIQNLSFKEKALNKIVDFYLKVRKEAENNLLDGVGHKPHFSLRSLCRALTIASKNPCGMMKRSLYEAFCLSFLTQLDADSYIIVQNMIKSYLIEKDEVKAVLNQPIPKPDSSVVSYVQFEGYWVQQGNLECTIPDDYILTDYVRKNLKDLVRVVSIGKLPVLLQGDTSVGKTSLITYLAKASGNKCVRINNHEHTDLQEYIGSYVADINGKLVFREGLLVEAMRQGHWIILDELNLAPTDVLEALNRVLDDNRELFIPETQQVVKAHQNFMLFATQNPPGAYGGRKMLSRAFRNRFVELHFTEIPPNELEFILHKRCQIAPSYAKKMISVMTDLQIRRRGSAAFAGKQGFITLRDLFRWGERYRLAENLDKLYDWDQHLADEGYLVLAGRVRKLEEKKEIITVLQKHLKREVIPDNLFTLSSSTSSVTRKILEDIHKNQEKNKNIVWTFSMRQLAVLVAKAIQFKEPVLLVGETGGGKTTVCKVIADNNGQELVTVNCHMHTESSDFIGGLRPVRNHEDNERLFEWVNGPLIQAMVKGSVFLADEISLADDSVLERLNSLLEPERCLLLAEKGTDINNPDTSEMIKAHNDFYFIGTMNPGGDFGKKELSPALRNRFTEIWCEPCTIRDDLIAIVEANINEGVSFGNQEDGTSGIGKRIMDFIEWFRSNIDIGKKFTISIRDILTWVNFINTCSSSVEIHEAYVHGASLTFLDSFGSGVTSGENFKVLEKFKNTCLNVLNEQVRKLGFPAVELCNDDLKIKISGGKFGIKPFFIDLDNQINVQREFFFNAPTTLLNCLRVLRGMQLHKAILLEGSPGVGKTSLVTALAEFSGHKIYRINLSDQTDISDLFGADLPVEGGTGGQFSWKDGPLLQALKQGHWILLDELNLASQSVLEGLNACLDHRGEIFIPELGKTFHVKEGTRFFAAQNPLKQGGSRRGLPQSFLNRFIQVYIDTLTSKDLHFILTKQFPKIPVETITKMIEFNMRMDEQLASHKFGNKGAPWECNLRDLTRWCEATIYHHKFNKTEMDNSYHPEALVNLLYADRMRTLSDKEKVFEIFEEVFCCKIGGTKPILYLNQKRVYFGDVHLDKDSVGEVQIKRGEDSDCLVLRNQLPTLRSLSYCVNLGWMSILVGSSGCGKSGVVKTLASLAGKTLKTFPVTSAMDTTDILGGFEQTDYSRHLDELHRETEAILNGCLRSLLLSKKIKEAVGALQLWESLQRLQEQEIKTIKEEIQLFIRKLDKLRSVWDYIDELKLAPDDSVERLKQKEGILRRNVQDERSLNAGGKFEWVDSVLIKCLQNGHWLLVDNVNLCSSAVLDRLNALLEPRGVLTIGERGVDKDGCVMEIKPHKDFRLFLTMDPKNGEISRAMRNRGVEIYLLNDREASRNDLDVKSMIQINGLETRKHIRVLLHMHEFLSDLILGEKPTINELLQAASLISQQLRYGVDEIQAFRSTLIEVYYKTRSPVEFNTKQVDQELTEELKTQLEFSVDENVKNDWYNENFTVNTNNRETSSELKKFKQQSALIHSLLRKNVTLKYDIFEYLLAIFYSMSTPNDLKARYDYLRYALGNDDDNVARLTNQLFEVLKNSTFEVKDLPVDHRWLPDTVYREQNSSDVNLTMLKLLLTVYNHNNDKLKTKKPKVALIDYMQARRRNEIVDKFNDVIVTDFLSLLEAFDSNLIASLQREDLRLTDEEVILILYLSKWRFAFFNCSLVDVTNKREHAKILTNIKVHYNWFLKYAVKDMLKALKQNESEDLGTILHRINLVMDRQSSGLFKIGKNYQKHISRPPPYTERSHLEVTQEFDFISGFYNICDRRNKSKTVLTLLENDSNTRNILIDLKVNLTFNFESVEEKMDVLKLVHTKNESETLKTLDKYRVEFVPFVHYIEEFVVRRNIVSEKIDEQLLSNSMVIPTDLVATCLKFARSQDERLIHELVKCYFLYLNDSPSGHVEEYLENDEKENAYIALSGHHPKLSFYLSKLLIRSETDEINTTKLGNFRDLMNQHRTLNVTLWKNLRALHSVDYDFINTESTYVKRDLHSFLKQLSASFKFDNNSSTHPELVEKCVAEIKNFQNSVTSAEHRDAIIKFAETLQKCYKNVDKLSEPSYNTNEKIELIATIHTQLGFMKLTLTSQLHLIDPLTKKAIKKEHLEQAILDFEGLKTCFELQNKVFSASLDTVHLLHKPIKEMIENMTLKTHALGEYVAVRSEKVQYESVFMIIKNSMNSILSKGSFEKIEELTLRINELITAINKGGSISLIEMEKILSRHEPSLKSYENTILEWSKYRISYPDIVEPLLSNVAQFLYGYKMKVSVLRKLLEQYKFMQQNINIEKTMTSLVEYPALNRDQTDYIEYINSYSNQDIQNFIEDIMKNEQHIASIENLRLLKCGIQEAFNTCVVYGSSEILNTTIYGQFIKLIEVFVTKYQEQEQRKEEEKKEAESIYKMKTKCKDLTEDEEVEEEIKELFTNFHSIDFADMQPRVQLADEAESEITGEEHKSAEISYEDLKFVSELHTSLVQNFTRSEWLKPEKNKSIICNFVHPVVQKFKVFRHLLDKVVRSLDYNMDKDLFGSFSVLLGVIQKYGKEELEDQEGSPSRICRNEYSDFYKDADVDEVKSCYHILEDLRRRIEELLDEWPEQPTLKTIVEVINRIYNFDINSPVSRFLTGFEILLTKCHEWEQVAHSGVSLSQFEQNIIQQIITWRKKELAMWRNLLNSTFDKLNDSKAKWWLYLFKVTEQFITEKLFTVEELITTLQKFITNSNIAEFQMRLDLLYTFHCFAVNFRDSKNQSEAKVYQNVLWNLYQYYNQFSECIALKIKELRTPVEKKLKDYVKIVKWKDISYWSVKDTVDKSHKILHKHVREFKTIMSQPVVKFLIHTNTAGNKDENVGIWDRPQRKSPKKYHYTMDAVSYMAKKSITKHTEKGPELSMAQESRIISKMNSYFNKSRTLCKDIVEATKYPDLVRDMDEFVAEVIQTSNHLQKLEVDTTQPKNKQKSQAKNILQQKHRALADLFKTLSKMGLSFRTGLVDNSTKNNIEEFTIKPVDLAATFGYIGNNKNDEKILTIWDSCELYFLRSSIRFNTLESAILQPAKDLGLSNIERCHGYTAHLLSLSHKQKNDMIEMSRSIYYLRHCFNNLSRFCNSSEFIEADYLEKLSSLMKKLTIVSKQYKVILNTFPVEDPLNVTQVQIVELNNKTEFAKYKYDSCWNNLYSSFNSLTELADKIQTLIAKCRKTVPCLDFVLKEPSLFPVEDGLLISSNLEMILEKSRGILTSISDTHLQNSLKWLVEEIEDAKNKFILKNSSNTTETEILKEFKANIEKSSSKILVVIQEMFKKYSRQNMEETIEKDEQADSEKDQLKTLIENLLNDNKQLDSKKVLKTVKKVTESLYSGCLPLGEKEKLITNQYLSLLEQMILLYQYFLTQQVSSYRVTCKLNSVLLNIFIELAGKGFCIPPELSDEMEEQGPGQPSDGMGLGDGKGEKDVSDKIESEDQLDEAQVEGQEKEKEEDPDCKEEDNGIEMNEDFDSKLQDIEKDKNEDDEDQDDNDSDAEEQMGETEKGANKLDDEVWGSDKDDDGEASEEEDNQEEETGNKGEDENDQQIGAKDKDSKDKPTDEDKEEPGEDQEKNQKEINEFEEPEVAEDQVDPYHGNLPEPPEPEPMDLPDDLQLDEGEEDKEEQTEDNPFDIDTMKEQNIPEDHEETPEEKEEKQKEDVEFESDDEEIKKGDKEDEPQENDEIQEEEQSNETEDKKEEKGEENQMENPEEDKENTEDEKIDDQSAADQTQSNEDQVEAMEVDAAEAADKTQGTESESHSNQQIDELQQEDKPDQDGVGQSQMEESQTGHSTQTDKPQQADTTNKEKQDLKRKERPGESDIQRSLGDVNEPVQKKLKTIDAKNNEEDEASGEQEEDKAEAEMYKHIKDAKEDATQVLDAATKEQAEAQKEKTVPNKEEEEAEEPTESSQDLPEEEDDENMDIAEGVKQKPEKLEDQKDKKKNNKSHPDGDVLEELENIEIEGEIIETATVARAPESSHHTHFDGEAIDVETTLSIEEMNALRTEVEQQMSSWYEPPSDVDAEQTWQKISSVTSSLAQELSEQLTLVLEPTQASRLKGDYRTGRRINMRKVIPYIASQFRKDKIWLRRTKPSKREYQIVLAIDDSSSMADNKSKEMAFESVALISKALTLLESGQLSILSFGEQTEVLHKLSDQFTEKSGVKLLQKFKFAQTKTRLAKMVDFATEMLSYSQTQTNSLTAKLLIIISDGRGVFSEGETLMRQAVRRGKLANIFTVFVIIDNPDNKHSVLDIRMPIFKDGKLEKISSYMDVFPFSFYILLRDLVSLPNVLSDALRQWFEMVSNLDK
ncbi:midasin [Coccinella septempunctata]|uniref:midasin n=1 Tax=Coccinella septempunctata TaxID=41139 RepID=UPI001D091393|nr:midasin [Coccinella septempunctata]